MSWPRGCGVRCLYILLSLTGFRYTVAQEPIASPIDISGKADIRQYQFLAPVLQNAQVVSLTESIHMTHEFPLVRIGMVRWLHENLGYDVVAMEGSPEDLWVSQDAFLRDPSHLEQSTSGLFGIWNTTEMQQLFAYESSTWTSEDPLYITAYDIQPGTGRSSQGMRVFLLLAHALAQYAPAPADLNIQLWSADLGLLSGACSQFQPQDAEKIQHAIDILQRWVNRAAPSVDQMYPRLPHGKVLRLIPENLRDSLALCQTARSDGKITAALYKRTRDQLAAQFALRLKRAAPNSKLILWAHASHLFYDADGRGNTSVGELLHASLGPRLYTIGTFAQAGSAIMLFSDWRNIIGYGRIWGVSSSLKRILGGTCGNICFFDLRGVSPDSPLSKPQHVWFESTPVLALTLSRDFDGIVWVKTVHPPTMSLPRILAYCSAPYWVIVVLVLTLIGGVALLAGLTIYRRRRKSQPRLDVVSAQ